MKNLFLIIALLISTMTTTFAQDIIELKSGEKLEVTITKIDKENIEFRPYGKSTDEAVIVVDKILIKSYKFEYATTATSTLAEKLTNIETKDLYDNRTFIAIKTQPLQLLTQNYKLSYEQNIAFNQSFEVELGLRVKPFYGMFEENNYAPQFNSTFRYKYFYRPTSMKMTDTGKNPLNGLYIAPVASLGNSTSMNYNSSYDNSINRASNLYTAGFIDIGYQFTVNRAIVDSFVGVGASLNSENRDFSSNNSHTSLNIAAVRAGFRMGLNFAQ